MKSRWPCGALLLLGAAPLFAQGGQPAPPNQYEIVIGPTYAPTPDLAIPRGTIVGFTMESKDSKIYPGIVRVENAASARRDAWGNRVPAKTADEFSRPQPYSRKVYVYVPATYPRGTAAPTAAPAYPFMVVQDGTSYVSRLVPVLDRMIADKRIPPLIVVFVNNGGSDAQGSQRGLEYDTIDDAYARFVETEVLPRAAQEANVAFTPDPSGRATMGCSSGAAAAFTMAWFHPEWYSRVLSYSGTFVNQASPIAAATPRGAWEYHATLVPNAPKKNIRVWMHVSDHDNHYNDPEQSWHNWPLANKRLAAALKAKGYDYRFVTSLDAGHCDARVIAQTLPEALEWTWAGYPR